MDESTNGQLDKLRRSVNDHEFLHRIRRRIEQLLRIVFHAEELEARFVRAAAEEILIADIVTRHGGQIDGVYFALRKVEESGHPWEQAIADYAAYVHNYFTTPLGIVMRKNLFGEKAHFVSPAAGRLSALYRGEPLPTPKSSGREGDGRSRKNEARPNEISP